MVLPHPFQTAYQCPVFGNVVCGLPYILTNVLEEISEYIGETTNNVAEYRALISGLEGVRKYHPKELEMFSDSELLVKQINGQYKVRSPSILPLYKEAKRLAETLPKWKIRHIPREENPLADALANRAIDEHCGCP